MEKRGNGNITHGASYNIRVIATRIIVITIIIIVNIIVIIVGSRRIYDTVEITICVYVSRHERKA